MVTEIKPLWYFTPFYSILRATTEDMVNYGLTPLVIFMGALTAFSVRKRITRVVTIGIAVLLLIGFHGIGFIGLPKLEAKVWGVVLMGTSLASLLLVPWLDRSPVKSIRYRGWMFKTALAIFTVAFIVLGFLGTRPPSGLAAVLAQVGTVLYFLFFLLMPWYTTFDKTKPVPERVTK